MPRKKTSPGLPHAVIDNTLLSRLVELEIAVFLPLLFKKIRIPREVRREAYASPRKGKRRLRKLVREDEKKGRHHAQTMGLEVFRTGKLLCLLKEAGAIEAVKPYLDQLKRMKFHLDEQAVRQILAEADEEC